LALDWSLIVRQTWFGKILTTREMILVNKVLSILRRLWAESQGGVFVEYILLLSIIGIGAIVGLAVVRNALIDELNQLAQAITAIIS